MAPATPHYIVLDFETTGLDPADSELIEIGAIEMRGLEAVDRFSTLIRPERGVPRTISQLTGITNEMLASEKPLAEALPAFLDFARDLPFVAHNAAMEQRFLDHHVAPLSAVGAFTVHNSIDPLALILPDQPSLGLEALRRWAGQSLEGSHRALQDCEALLAVLAHAHAWMRSTRPALGRVARALLGPGPAARAPWWWSWYFDDEGAPVDDVSYIPALLADRPFLGDLRQLRTQDAARESPPDAEASVTREQVHAALAAPAEEGFQYREAQERMAQEVRSALAAGEKVAIEAPTGTGKSIAYLVPGVLAAEASGRPLVVSTHSKSLQDQLLEKDVPRAGRLLGGRTLKAATVKGQENYVCLRKLAQLTESVWEEEDVDSRWSAAFLVSFASVSGVAELDRVSAYLRGQSATLGESLDWVRSHYTTTMGPRCPFHKACHFYDSARLAHGSDVIIANHALVFQWPSHLPQIRDIVFDEAHHLEEQITEAYSVKLSEENVVEGVDRLSKRRGSGRTGDAKKITRLLASPRVKPHLPGHFAEVDPGVHLAQVTDLIRSRLVQIRSLVPLALPPDRDASDGYDETIDFGASGAPAARETLVEGLANLAGAMSDARAYLAAGVEACERAEVPRDDAAFDALKTHAYRFESQEKKVRALLNEADDNWVRLLHWSPRENAWKLHVAAIDVGKLAHEFFESKRAAVLTSATLSAGTAPTWVTDRIGLKLSRPFVALPSPYRLEEQAVAYLPTDVAPPGTSSHLEALIGFTEQVAALLGGRTLLLMTSNRRLRVAAETLRGRLEGRGITVLDSLSDRRAAEIFRATDRALLIGGERYGEGLDIPGRQLACVIVEKINEAMTRSPLAEARKSRTKFGLYDYDFPLRMMWLKQRVGRLVRSPSDRGAVVVFDPRYHGWSAASRNHVKRALAPIPIQTGTREEILRRLESSGI
jgi:ATP-dependent DNA helicase DinG